VPTLRKVHLSALFAVLRMARPDMRALRARSTASQHDTCSARTRQGAEGPFYRQGTRTVPPTCRIAPGSGKRPNGWFARSNLHLGVIGAVAVDREIISDGLRFSSAVKVCQRLARATRNRPTQGAVTRVDVTIVKSRAADLRCAVLCHGPQAAPECGPAQIPAVAQHLKLRITGSLTGDVMNLRFSRSDVSELQPT
jgi:hypothetical protein